MGNESQQSAPPHGPGRLRVGFDQVSRTTIPPHPATVSTTSAHNPRRARPLLVTADPQLLADVLGLARRSGVDMDVTADPGTARDRYGTAPLVLVGVDVVVSCIRARLPRRPGVIVIGLQRERDDDPPWAGTERLGAEHIVMLPAGAPWLIDRLSALVSPTRDGAVTVSSARTPTPVISPSDGALVAVLGGRGGAGTTVLACGLAVTAARSGRRTIVVDGDPLGGGIDRVFGLEGSPGLRWPNLPPTPNAMRIPVFDDALPQPGELAVLSSSREDDPTVPAETMVAVLNAARRGWDLAVVDLPRRFDDATVAALAAADHTLLVVPGELRACAAAARVAAEALRHTGSMSLVVRKTPAGRLSARAISRAIGLPLAGTLRSEPAIARGLERGEPPASTGQGSLATLCSRLLARLGPR